MTLDKLKEVIRLHVLWLGGEKTGVAANLMGVDLFGASIRKANLSFANLSGANLCNTDLYFVDFSCADLTNANLGGANLTWASLDSANLTGANLAVANLQGADLSWAIGNGREILTIQADQFHVNITNDQVWINDRHHTWEEWSKIDSDDKEIIDMDARGLDSATWWQEWKPKLSTIIDERNKSKYEQSDEGDQQCPCTVHP